MFAFRMTSHEDQDIVRSAVPEASHGLMNFLPALRNGEAIAVGEGVAMPMRICFSPLPEDRRPKSATASFTTAWSKDRSIYDCWSCRPKLVATYPQRVPPIRDGRL
jgi:DNA helicase HerA-like ATPase